MPFPCGPAGVRGGGVIHKLVQAQKICKMSAKFFKKWFLKFLKQFGNLQIKPVQNMHRKGGTGKVRRGPAWCQVLYGRFGLVGIFFYNFFFAIFFSSANHSFLTKFFLTQFYLHNFFVKIFFCKYFFVGNFFLVKYFF